MVVTDSQNVFQYKIAYVSDQRFPIRSATSEQVINTVSALAGEGVNIDLIIPGKWRNLGARKKVHKKKLLEFYNVMDGFSISPLVHLPFAPAKLEKVSHGLIGPFYAGITNHNIVYTRNFLPALISTMLGKKVIFETFHVFDQFRTKTGKYLAQLSQSQNFLSIITHSRPSKESLIKAGVLEKKTSLIHNGFNPEPFVPRLTKAEARQKLGWNEKEKIVCYAGRIDLDKGISSIIELARRTPEIKFVVIGYSERETDDWILNLANQMELQNVAWFPWVTINELTKFLFASDVLLIPPTTAPMSKYGRTVLPMKTFIYMAAGRCIMAPALPDTKDILNKENAALVEPDNIDLAEKTLRRIFEDNAWSESIAKQAQSDSRNYTWQSRAKKIIACLNERLNDNR